MAERLPDTFVEQLTPAMEAQIRESIVAHGRPRRRLRWAVPVLLAELERLRDAEATGRAAVRALAAIQSRSVWGVHTSPATSCCRCALDHEVDAVLATDTAKAWLSEEGQ